MKHQPGFRPFVTTQSRAWVDRETGDRVPGIALMHGAKVVAHMTPEEAKAMAEQLLRYADQLEKDEN